jgi:hypothetical protein
MQQNPRSRGLKFPLLAVLGVLALLIGTISALTPVTPSFAEPGDGTVFHGGPPNAAGNSGTLQLDPGQSGDYAVYAIIPSGAGSNLAAAEIEIDYDQTKVTANSCTSGVAGDADTQLSCNPNDGGVVHLAFANVDTQGLGFVPGESPVKLVTINFSALAGAPDTDDAILSVTIVGGSCLNGANNAITCTETLGAVQIGDDTGDGLWGDLNCSTTLTAADLSIAKVIAAGGNRPAGCSQTADLNCSGTVNAADIAIEKRIVAGDPNAPGPCGQVAVPKLNPASFGLIPVRGVGIA